MVHLKIELMAPLHNKHFGERHRSGQIELFLFVWLAPKTDFVKLIHAPFIE